MTHYQISFACTMADLTAFFVSSVTLTRGNLTSSEANFNVDSKILGGIKVRIGNKIIDGSVSTKLKKIKQSLLGI